MNVYYHLLEKRKPSTCLNCTTSHARLGCDSALASETWSRANEHPCHETHL
jgi:hypothetical protein